MAIARTRLPGYRQPVIANGTATSSVIDAGDFAITALIMPAAWSAAALTFIAVGPDGAEYPVYDDAGTWRPVPSR